jgi:hypothetical protein
MSGPIRKLGMVLLLMGLPAGGTFRAQDFSDLYDLYQKKNIDALKQRVEQLAAQYTQNKEIMFFSTLFMEDGEEAFKTYEQLYTQAEGQLRNIIGEKLAQYYYACGFYVRAAEFKNGQPAVSPAAATAAGPNRDGKGVEKQQSNFVIQVGAFGQEDNARQLQKILQARDIKARLVTRQVNGQNLYCVWIAGTNSLNETLQIAENLKERFKLEYRILEN